VRASPQRLGKSLKSYRVAPGAWSVDGHVRVKTISLKDGGVHIRGQRSFLFFDPEEKQLRALGSVTKTENVSKRFREKVGDWAAKEGRKD
jgi:hypothetical protein